MSQGKLIVMEGVDGAGKSIQLQHLHELLEHHGIDVHVSREPGGTPLAEQIRELLLSPREETVHPVTELLLFYAARQQHVVMLRELLAAGTWVICDRYVYSSYAYQIFARGIDVRHYHYLNEWVVMDTTPDLLLFLDIPNDVQADRLQGRAEKSDRLDQEADAFHQQVNAAYREIARTDPQAVMIDASGTIDEVRTHLEAVVYDQLIHPHQRAQSTRVT